MGNWQISHHKHSQSSELVYISSFHLPDTTLVCELDFYKQASEDKKKKKRGSASKHKLEQHVVVFYKYTDIALVQMAVNYKPIHQRHSSGSNAANSFPLCDISTVLIPLTHQPSNHRAKSENQGKWQRNRLKIWFGYLITTLVFPSFFIHDFGCLFPVILYYKYLPHFGMKISPPRRSINVKIFVFCINT